MQLEPPAPPSGPQSYGRSVLFSARALDPSRLPSTASSAYATLAASPCLRPTVLWAATVSSLLVAHRILQGGGTLRRCANDAFLGALLTAGYQWYTCRNAEHDMKLTTRAYYQAQQDRQLGIGEFAPPAGGAVDADSGVWRKKLEALEK